jgi:hypothetical protein
LRSYRMKEAFQIGGESGESGDWIVVEANIPLIVKNVVFKKQFFEL